MDVINYVSIGSLVNTKGETKGLFFTLPTRGCLESCSLQWGNGAVEGLVPDPSA